LFYQHAQFEQHIL